MIKGENERILLDMLNEAYPNMWETEYQGIPGRKYRFDCACQKLKVAVEIEGGIFIRGGHTAPMGYQKDMEKYNLAAIEGWKVLRYSPDTLRKMPWKILKDLSYLIGCPKNQMRLDMLAELSQRQVQVAIS